MSAQRSGVDVCVVFGVVKALLLSSGIKGIEAAGVASWSAKVAMAKSDRPAHEFVRGAKLGPSLVASTIKGLW